MNYSKGVFLRLLSNDINVWQQELDFVNSLPHLQHLELWMEDLNLTDTHIAAWVGFQPLSPNQPLRQAALTIINQTLTIATRINAQLITIHLGSFLSFQTIPDLIRHVEPGLKQIITSSQKPLVAVENMP
jgi:sugar phosphate isomerase/epimerase